MKRLWLLALLLLPVSAWAQGCTTNLAACPSPRFNSVTANSINGPFTPGPIVNTTINNTPIGSTTPSTGAFTTLSGSPTATGSTTARGLAARFAERINVRDYGALGDAQSVNTLPVTVGSGSAAVTITGGSFSSADIGKRFNVDGAGPLRTLGFVASVPVTAAGSGYTAAPGVAFSGLGTASGVVGVAQMAAQSATLVNGGSGCPNSSAITLTLVGGTGTAAQVSGTTNSSGVLVGALTVAVAGSYTPGTATRALLALSAVTTTSASTCSTYPTVLPSWGVGSILMAGIGANVPLTGVAAALDSGSGTLGTPVVSQVVTPLSGVILAVNDAQHIVLDTPATTPLSAASVAITWGHDDTAAFTAAKARTDALFTTTGVSPCLYASAGNYLISAPIPTFYLNPGCIYGDGTDKTQFKLDAIMSGPLFSWSENWTGGGSTPQFGSTMAFSQQVVGPIADSFSVVGDITVANEQDFLVLYDRNDRVQFNHLKAYYLWGRFAYTGILQNKSQSFMRESIWNDMYAGHSGTPFAPLIELSSIISVPGDSTDTNFFSNIEGWDLGGQGIVIRSQSPADIDPVNYMSFRSIRMEGALSTVSADQIQIGDPTMTGVVSSVNMDDVFLIAGNFGSSALKFAAPAIASRPVFVNIQHLTISADQGQGINVQAGANIQIGATTISSLGTKLQVASSTLVSGPITFNVGGAEQIYTYAIDATSTGAVLLPVFKTGDPTNASGVAPQGGFGVTVHDGTILGGNTLGPGAVDMQSTRTAASQAAVAGMSTISGGKLNSVGLGAVGAAITGGSLNLLNGIYSRAGGNGAGDHGLTGFDAWADAPFVGTGDAQIFRTILRGSASSTSAFRLTADGNSAAGTNCLNILDAYSVSFSLMVHVRDATTAGNDYSWIVPNVMMTRDTGAASTLLTLGTPVILSRGTTPTVAATADTTNGCLNVTVTPPGANSDTLHAVAEISGVMVH